MGIGDDEDGEGERLGPDKARLSDAMSVGDRSALKLNCVGLRSYDAGRIGLRVMVG